MGDTMTYMIEYVNVLDGKMYKAETEAKTHDEACEIFESRNDGCAVVYVKEKNKEDLK